MKSAAKATCLSAFVFPGLGQFYLQHHIKGLIFSIIAAISFFMIMSAVFDIAFTIADGIKAGKVSLDNATINNLTQQITDIFKQPSMLAAKAAIIISWLISSIDAWLSGKKIEKNKI